MWQTAANAVSCRRVMPPCRVTPGCREMLARGRGVVGGSGESWFGRGAAASSSQAQQIFRNQYSLLALPVACNSVTHARPIPGNACSSAVCPLWSTAPACRMHSANLRAAGLLPRCLLTGVSFYFWVQQSRCGQLRPRGAYYWGILVSGSAIASLTPTSAEAGDEEYKKNSFHASLPPCTIPEVHFARGSPRPRLCISGNVGCLSD